MYMYLYDITNRDLYYPDLERGIVALNGGSSSMSDRIPILRSGAGDPFIVKL